MPSTAPVVDISFDRRRHDASHPALSNAARSRGHLLARVSRCQARESLPLSLSPVVERYRAMRRSPLEVRYRATSLPRAADLLPARNGYRSHSLRWNQMRVLSRAEHDRWRCQSIDRAQSSSWRLESRSRRRARPATSIIVTKISMNVCRRFQPSSKPLACFERCIGFFGPLTRRRPAVGVPMIALK